MKLAVFGATGATGLLIVEQALAQGHAVVALVRNPSAFGQNYTQNAGLSAIVVDIFNSESMVASMKDCDAVISCLGLRGIAFKKTLAMGRQMSDMKLMEVYLASKSNTIDFTCVRSPTLDDSPGTTDREVLAFPDSRSPPFEEGEKKVGTISRSDVARFMLSILTDPNEGSRFIGRCVAICYGDFPTTKRENDEPKTPPTPD